MNGIDEQVIEAHRRRHLEQWMRYQNSMPIAYAPSIARRAIAFVARDQQILQMRNDGATLKTIGLRFNLAPSRIGQICERARRWSRRDAHAR